MADDYVGSVHTISDSFTFAREHDEPGGGGAGLQRSSPSERVLVTSVCRSCSSSCTAASAPPSATQALEPQQRSTLPRAMFARWLLSSCGWQTGSTSKRDPQTGDRPGRR